MLKQFKIETQRKQELIDITGKINEIVKISNVFNGICLVYIPHTTSGILINENYDKNLCNDILNSLDKLIPKKAKYEHDKIDSNAHAHIKSAIIKQSELFIIKNNILVLGTYQGIALAEFDGPRARKVYIKIIKG